MSGLDRGVWQRFEHDPRLPGHQHLRASDVDRDVISDVLAEAYGEGRLDREELDERSDQLRAAKTLGELPPLVADLVADQSSPRPATRDMRAEAERAFDARRRQALLSFLTPTLICWAIWLATTPGGFPWPIFVTIGTAMGPLAVLVNGRESQVADIQAKMEEKHLRREEKRQRRLHGLPMPPTPPLPPGMPPPPWARREPPEPWERPGRGSGS